LKFEAIYSMHLTERCTLVSARNRECEYVVWPCKITSDVTGESAVLEDLTAFEAFLARHCAAIPFCMVDQAAIVDWVANQDVQTSHVNVPVNAGGDRTDVPALHCLNAPYPAR